MPTTASRPAVTRSATSGDCSRITNVRKAVREKSCLYRISVGSHGLATNGVADMVTGRGREGACTVPEGNELVHTNAEDDAEAVTCWMFLTNHAHVLLAIAADPSARMREVAARVGVTERSVQMIVADLVTDGYLTRIRVGRRNRYTVNRAGAFRHPAESDHRVGELLELFENRG